VDEALTAAGWDVLRVWEHEDSSAALERVIEAVGTRSARCPKRPTEPLPDGRSVRRLC
jgi:very-short-patch-repair endonuclease